MNENGEKLHMVGDSAPLLAEPDHQAYLAAIVDSMEDAVISKDLNGIITSWNRGAEKMFGYLAEEALGHSIYMLVPPERHSEEEMVFARIRRGEKVEHFETQRRKKDGTYIDVSVTISPIKNSSGAVIGASKIARDIRDRVAADTDRARLSAIIDSSDDAIISKDLTGVVQSWNRGAERLFGFMAEEMIGQPITKILPPDRLEEEDRILRRLSKGQRVDHYETVRQHRDGRLLDVSVTISPIRDTFGRIIGASKVARNISDRKIFETTMARVTEELEQRVSERTAALEQAHQEMESFTHSIAHDLRGPLRAIASTSAMLQEDYGDTLSEGGRRLLARQIGAAKRLAQLIDDLLRYSRLGRTGITIEPVDLTSLAKDVAAEIGSSSEGCEFHIEEGMTTSGDRSLIRLLLQNLMDNGCKFSRDHGVIEVGRRAEAFFVKDNGRGFDMAYAEKIFQPFERLVNNDEVPGTGIGLANVKRIIEKHSGRIWVTSSEGAGTTFFFTLGEARPNK